MRIAMWWLVIVLVGCAASTAQVKTANDAEYKVAAATMFDLAKEVASDDYKIGESDPSTLRFVTAAQFYSAEGGRQSAGADDTVTITPGSIRLELLVEVADVGLSRVAVKITPRVLQMVTGSPQPRELKPDDPSMPPWVQGRIDALMVAIYERGKQYIEKP